MTRRFSAFVVLAATLAAAAVAAQDTRKGRFKVDGDNCVYDLTDTGPDQCQPQVPGRFKKDKDACVWDAKDKGPDQCTPPTGRWKTDGSRCVWEPKDSGPNQCNPRRLRKQ
jgi:hypothetical protein